MSNDLVADLLTRIRNSQMIGRRSVDVKASKLVERVLGVLKSEGFVAGYAHKSSDAVSGSAGEASGAQKLISVDLKYFPDGQPLISSARRMSRSGRRMYLGCDSLPRVEAGLGMAVVSTSEGVMSDKEARKRNIGGELLLIIS